MNNEITYLTEEQVKEIRTDVDLFTKIVNIRFGDVSSVFVTIIGEKITYVPIKENTDYPVNRRLIKITDLYEASYAFIANIDGTVHLIKARPNEAIDKDIDKLKFVLRKRKTKIIEFIFSASKSNGVDFKMIKGKFENNLDNGFEILEKYTIPSHIKEKDFETRAMIYKKLNNKTMEQKKKEEKKIFNPLSGGKDIRYPYEKVIVFDPEGFEKLIPLELEIFNKDSFLYELGVLTADVFADINDSSRTLLECLNYKKFRHEDRFKEGFIAELENNDVSEGLWTPLDYYNRLINECEKEGN